MLSVIMSVYNEREEWIRATIESVLSQTFKDFEFIIILDNPDNKYLEEIIKEYENKDKRIMVYKNSVNRGLVFSLNKALSLSNGEYVARIDADDICIKNRFEIQYNFLKNNLQYHLIGGSIEIIDEDGNTIDDNIEKIEDYNYIKYALRYRNIMCHPTYMFRKESVINVGGYNEVKFAEDYDLVTRIILNDYKICNINKVLVKYRVRQSGVTKSNSIAQRYAALYVRKNYRRKIINLNEYAYTGNLNPIYELYRIRDILFFNIFKLWYKFKKSVSRMN